MNATTIDIPLPQFSLPPLERTLSTTTLSPNTSFLENTNMILLHSAFFFFRPQHLEKHSGTDNEWFYNTGVHLSTYVSLSLSVEVCVYMCVRVYECGNSMGIFFS